MKFHRDTFRALFKPGWLAIIVVSTLMAALAALFVGLQQDAGETSTTFLFGRRIGYLNRPLPVLDDHLNEIINSVEFPEVFVEIEDRVQLRADRDYELEIGVVEDTQSLVKVVVRTDRSGEAERIARIVAEEMVAFVLESQDLSVSTAIDELQDEIDRIEDEQETLAALAGGVPPITAQNRLERSLIAVRASDTPVGPLEAEIREQLSVVTPLANDYQRNTISLNNLRRQQSNAIVERTDLLASQASINQEWYRSITPVERTSNVPVAIAMAFAAGVPAGVAAVMLVALNINYRLRRDELRLAGA